MPFKSIHPLNHPAPASLLLDQCQAELFQGPWKNMIYLCDWISCSCRIPCLSATFSAYQINFTKEHSSCIPEWDISFTWLWEVFRHANFGGTKLSFRLVHCLKRKKEKNLFPIVSLHLPHPKRLPQFRKKKKKCLFKYLCPNQKKCNFLILFNSVWLLLPENRSIDF